MKLLFVSLLYLSIIQIATKADDDKPIQIHQMPQQAQEFIQEHFSNCKIALAKAECDFFDKNYEIIFTNGNKIKFDRRGNWKEINCKYTFVPSSIIPPKILQYIINSYPNTTVSKLECNKKYYKIKLSNHLELKFSLKSTLLELNSTNKLL